MGRPVVISFEHPRVWEQERENVDSILNDYTGTSDYPSTRSIPPIIFGAELDEDAIEELRNLQGIQVGYADENNED